MTSLRKMTFDQISFDTSKIIGILYHQSTDSTSNTFPFVEFGRRRGQGDGHGCDGFAETEAIYSRRR